MENITHLDNLSTDELNNKIGMITDIERYAINDGFGLRTTVFLKGCPLHCRWCSNPETQKYNKEMVFFQDKCISCMECQKSCEYSALENSLIADRSICKDCHTRHDAFKCIEHCYPKCRKIVGDEKTVKDVVKIVKRDMSFYQLSGGGVTISGGEPMTQFVYLFSLLKVLCENWIDTAIETCGACDAELYEIIAPYLKFVFMDLKSMNSIKLKDWTGGDLNKIKKSILKVDELCNTNDLQLIIRTPIIPGFNDMDEEVEEIAKFVSENCKNYKGMELLPYHRLGRGKYTSMGREFDLADVTTPSDKRMRELNVILHKYNIPIYKF